MAPGPKFPPHGSLSPAFLGTQGPKSQSLEKLAAFQQPGQHGGDSAATQQFLRSVVDERGSGTMQTQKVGNQVGPRPVRLFPLSRHRVSTSTGLEPTRGECSERVRCWVGAVGASGRKWKWAQRPQWVQ